MRVLFLILMLTAIGSAQPNRYILENAVIHTGTEAPFTGWVAVEGEVIESVGRGPAPEGPSEDLAGQHLFPALIDADSALGLVGIESLRATRDYAEVGDLNPNLVAQLAFRAENETVPVARSQGVLYSGVNPRGGAISGQGSVMRTWGWDWRDMTVRPTWALSVDWPGLNVSPTDSEKREESLAKIGQALFFLDDAFATARSYSQKETDDVKWSALKIYAEGKAPVLIRVDGKKQIRSALDWAADHGVKPVLVAGRDIHFFAQELAEKKIPVIYSSVFNQNPHRDQSYDLHYRVPGMLTDAGVTVALSPNGLSFDVRELRDLAGRVRAFGMSSELALQAITLNPARILGVDDQIGSIERGKKASFVLCDGDLLEVAPIVMRAWGEGREIDLDDPQKELYRRYREKLVPNS